MATYSVDLGFDTLTFSVDLAQASSPIMLQGEDGSWQSTQYQCADARHDLDQAAVLAISSCGGDYWHDPSEEWPENEDEFIRSLFSEVDVVEEEEAEEEEEEEEIEEVVRGIIRERGNSFPDVGDYVPGDDGQLYKIVKVSGRIETGNSGAGASNWMQASAVMVDWMDCEEDEIFQAQFEEGN